VPFTQKERCLSQRPAIGERNFTGKAMENKLKAVKKAAAGKELGNTFSGEQILKLHAERPHLLKRRRYKV
jgi:hypothetical protein